MEKYQELLDLLIKRSREILGGELVGIYLHVSAAMGCFHAQKSDLDLIVVIQNGISDETKRRYMDMVVELNAEAPEKGIEISVVKADVCDPFVYPTPFELHFSGIHLGWYRDAPEDYIAKMKGTDRDLAAHFTVLYHRGKTLYGKEIRDVFAEVEGRYYFDSILSDIENAQEEIAGQPVYMILNLCRVLAYKREQLIFSKKEGGEWGLSNIPAQYTGLITEAMRAYRTGDAIQPDEVLAKKYAEYMLTQIRNER